MIKCLATDQVWHVVKRQLLVVILINIQLAHKCGSNMVIYDHITVTSLYKV